MDSCHFLCFLLSLFLLKHSVQTLKSIFSLLSWKPPSNGTAVVIPLFVQPNIQQFKIYKPLLHCGGILYAGKRSQMSKTWKLHFMVYLSSLASNNKDPFLLLTAASPVLVKKKNNKKKHWPSPVHAGPISVPLFFLEKMAPQFFLTDLR